MILADAASPAIYAFGLGLVGALNPCGFPMVPAYLSLFLGEGDAGVAGRASRALAGAASVTAGFVAVFGVVGVVTESGFQIVSTWVPWAMIPVAAALVALGLAQGLGRPIHVPVLGGRHLARSRYRPVVLFGFGVSYGLASLSCALPVFLAGVAGSFTRSGFGAGLYDFVAYALGMGLLFAAVALAVVGAGAGALRHLRIASRAVPRAGGFLLAAVGVYLGYYWTSDLVHPSSTSRLAQDVGHVQSALSSWVSGSARWLGLGLGILVIGTLVGLAWRDGPVAPGRPRPLERAVPEPGRPAAEVSEAPAR